MTWVCLMYHGVLPSTKSTGGGPGRFSVPLGAFERVLDVIMEAGKTGRSMAEAARAPQASVAITFDDGARSQYDFAVPALVARRMTATFFVTTDWIGTDGFMSWEELRDIKAQGMSVQSHTRSHPFLSELDEPRLMDELAGSKAALDEGLDQDTHALSFPGGDPPRRRFRHLLSQCGYRQIAGSRWGLNRSQQGEAGDPPVLYRCNMRGEIERDEARRIIDGDRWLGVRNSSREALLNGVRSTMGPSRYKRVRSRILDAVSRS